MEGKVVSSCHAATKKNGERVWHLGRRIYLQVHTDQRLRVQRKRCRGVLQPSWWQGANLRRHEQWLWMEPVAEIIHVTEYGFLAHDSSRQKFL